MADLEFADARSAFETALAISKRLINVCPNRTIIQYNVAECYMQLAVLYSKSEEPEKEIDSLRSGKFILDQLTMISPVNANWRKTHIRFEEKMTALEE